MNENETETTSVPTCGMCRRKRSFADPEHAMDAYDYNPLRRHVVESTS